MAADYSTAILCLLKNYLPITNTPKVFGFTLDLGLGVSVVAGGIVKSATGIYTKCLASSSAIVFAPGVVGKFSNTL